MDNVRIGIIGTGQIAKIHIREYSAIPEANVVAIAGRDKEKVRLFSEENHIPNSYGDYKELLARDDIDAIDVCVHNNLHMPISVAAFEAGKDVYCEKPIAGSYADGQKMIQAAKSSGRKLAIQLASIFTDESKAAKKLIDNGNLGRIYHARSVGFRRRGRPFVDGYGSPQFVQKIHSAGGAMYDMGIYHLGLILYLIGNPKVHRISGKTYQEIDMDKERKEASGYDVEEMGVGLVRLENNISLDIIETWAVNTNDLGGSVILGSQGGICLNPFNYSFNIHDLEMDASVNLEALRFRLQSLREYPNAYDSPQKNWIACLKGHVGLIPTAEIALNSMLISEGIYLSEKLNREVTSEEIGEMSKSNSEKP